jgi:hypothetical protein
MYSVETDIKQSAADLVGNSTFQEFSKRICYYLITEKNIYQQTEQYQEMVFETIIRPIFDKTRKKDTQLHLLK